MRARRVLVTDGEQRAALAMVRSLGRAGHAVWVTSARRGALAGGSRWSRGEAVTADPLAAPERFASDVRERIAAWRIDTVLPVSEPALLALLPARDTLGDVLFPFPPVEVFRRLCDKGELLAAAPRAGIAVPEQLALQSPRDAAALDPATLDYPVVLKPSRSVGEHAGRRAKLAVRHVADAAQLSAALAELGDEAYPLLVQRRIVGPGVGIFLLLWEGRVLATFAHRRIREKPPSGGISVYRESIAAEPALVQRSRALLEQFAWCGVAMVEYKLDERTGTPYLMEVNGRFWGSLQLAIDAGVDFPRLLVDAAAGVPGRPVADYRVGVRSRWWWGDVDHLLARLRRSRAELSLPPDAPGRWRAIRDFFTVRALDREEILRPDDPRPFLRETLQWFRRS
ncbi:MAG TPA: ATP-grasp domain-containing protein [Gemmatimonadaceae bacterium]|nr:ATP-grasp domain-containing protein [Gemmatimonadaceae bacterium]